MIGVHGWGKVGTIGGLKAAAEYQHMELEGEQLKASSTITLACTAPRSAGDPPLSKAVPRCPVSIAWSVRVVHV